MSKNIFYFILAVAVLLAVGGLAVFITQQRTPQEQPQSIQQEEGPQQEEGFGSQLYENPAAKVPEANPLEGYKNPFE
ncbi:MAG: hypothetical protein HYT49_03580 [Candidatus Wildermuthbacteria bacterium]|nr:hypothetical protein [Candidatus Wildermuthbacteria bacterium]